MKKRRYIFIFGYKEIEAMNIGKIFGPIGGFLNDKGTDLFHSITGIPTAAEKRAVQNQINDQIKSYKEQTELTRKELTNKANEQAVQKRRIEEKQVRALRRNYRAGVALLGTQQTGQPDMSSKLGG